MVADLKRKLRQLKKLEKKIRFENTKLDAQRKFIWNDYFSTKDEEDETVKYSMSSLLSMDHEQRKEIFNEFFYNIYFQHYKENGITAKGMYDTKLLSNLGLPPDASFKDIKSKFRSLAKEYHPDVGGDSSKFIKLYDTYRKLIDE